MLIDHHLPAKDLTECRTRLQDLVAQFQANHATVRTSAYDETTCRVDFIDPFFAALGWDVNNVARRFGKAREVVPEARALGQRDRPDYAFVVAGEVKFFVEAKKPSTQLLTPAHIFQTKTYAYSRSAPLAVLTNFERLAAYHAAVPPVEQAPNHGMLPEFDIPYTDYVKAADRLWAVLGRPNVQAGSIEQHIISLYSGTKRRHTQPQTWLFEVPGWKPVDRLFLEKLSEWRRRLAIIFAKSNKFEHPEHLAEAVQVVLDRMVIIRVCEDRGIETKHRLREAVSAWIERKTAALYPALVALFRSMDPQYNSHLFKKHFSEKLAVEDEQALQSIIEELYPPISNYRFDVLPVDILGTTYERFLAETVVMTDGKVEVVEKQEVRHGGGVYYTPRWVVAAIVARTLGPLTANKPPGDLAKIRVLDPACGSGSFLLGAFQWLIDAHLDWYRANSLDAKGAVRHEYRNDVFIDGADELRMRVDRKREIAINSIFGVDKDPQAVEVAKLSLYLRVLEDLAGENLQLLKSHLLPDLSKNICNGNSLIAPGDVPNLLMIDEATRRIRPFDWKTRFAKGGTEAKFHAIVGNPPYIRIQEMLVYAPEEVEIIRSVFPAALQGNFDIYLAFVERGLGLLHPKGLMGFIMPMRWLKANYGEGLRKLISDNRTLDAIVDFGPEQVFEDATTYTGLQFFSHARTATIRYSLTKVGHDALPIVPLVNRREHKYPARALGVGPWYVGISPALRDLFEKLLSSKVTLGNTTQRISQGLKTGRDRVFVLHDAHHNQKDGTIRGYSKALDQIVEVEDAACKWLIKSGEMRRYHLRQSSRVVLFPYDVNDSGVAQLIPFWKLASRWPLLAEYLEKREDDLRMRERNRFDLDGSWHQFSRHQNMDLPGLKKIIVPDLVEINRFAYDDQATRCFMGGAAGGYGIVPKAEYNPWAMLGVLNSTLMEWLLRPPGLSDWFRGGWYNAEKRFIHSLPMLSPNVKFAQDLAKRAQALTEAHGRHASAVTDSDRERWEGVILVGEKAIDDIVFGGFAVNEEQRAAIEEEVRGLRTAVAGKGEEQADDPEAE